MWSRRSNKRQPAGWKTSLRHSKRRLQFDFLFPAIFPAFPAQDDLHTSPKTEHDFGSLRGQSLLKHWAGLPTTAHYWEAQLRLFVRCGSEQRSCEWICWIFWRKFISELAIIFGNRKKHLWKWKWIAFELNQLYFAKIPLFLNSGMVFMKFVASLICFCELGACWFREFALKWKQVQINKWMNQ